MRMPVKRYELIWSPEGRVIGEVDATSPRQAVKLTPAPYHQYKGEVYAREKEGSPSSYGRPSRVHPSPY